MLVGAREPVESLRASPTAAERHPRAADRFQIQVHRFVLKRRAVLRCDPGIALLRRRGSGAALTLTVRPHRLVDYHQRVGDRVEHLGQVAGHEDGPAFIAKIQQGPVQGDVGHDVQAVVRLVEQDVAGVTGHEDPAFIAEPQERTVQGDVGHHVQAVVRLVEQHVRADQRAHELHLLLHPRGVAVERIVKGVHLQLGDEPVAPRRPRSPVFRRLRYSRFSRPVSRVKK